MTIDGKEKEILEAIRLCVKTLGTGKVFDSAACNEPAQVVFTEYRAWNNHSDFIGVEIPVSNTTCGPKDEPLYRIYWGQVNGDPTHFHQCNSINELRFLLIEGIKYVHRLTDDELKSIFPELFEEE